MANTFTIKGKKATQKAYLAHAAYESAKAHILANKGKIVSEDGKMLVADFESNTNAKTFADAFERDYAKAHKAYAKAKGKTVKAKTEPKSDKNAPTRKPTRTKGNSVDFTQFKGTKSDKNKALHAYLVGIGHADSRTKEYQAVWSARPWAK